MKRTMSFRRLARERHQNKNKTLSSLDTMIADFDLKKPGQFFFDLMG